MCTVTWLPRMDGTCFLTSNRDEAPGRTAEEMVTRINAPGLKLWYPKDSNAGGTWICASENGKAACLLNGASKKHKHRPPYRKSRGLITLEAFDHDDFERFVHDVNLKGIEPFTLILAEQGRLMQLIWNGRIKTIAQPSYDAPHIWASSTLYPYAVREKRRQYLRRFLRENSSPEWDDIQQFHLQDLGDPENGFVINRGRVQTISLTSVMLLPKNIKAIHRNLLNHQVHTYE